MCCVGFMANLKDFRQTDMMIVFDTYPVGKRSFKQLLEGKLHTKKRIVYI